MPPGIPALKGSSVATGKPINRHILTVLNGIPNTAMQAFSSQLNDNELAAIITYERNAWGNNTGDIVQAYDVHILREGGKP
jgi:cytochrome c oxidase subunit II